LKDSTWSLTLTVPADGEVTELAGRPGMAVEAGGLVARLVDFRQTLVRLDIPAHLLRSGPPPQVELFTNGDSYPGIGVATGGTDLKSVLPSDRSAPPAVAALVGAAPQVDPASQFLGYWYETTSAGGWRPGLMVKTLLKVPEAKPKAAVSVSAAAVLYHQGRALVYVLISPGETQRYERREVQVFGREGNNWILAAGVSAGEPVVSRQAQVLLSEEFKGEVDND